LNTYIITSYRNGLTQQQLGGGQGQISAGTVTSPVDWLQRLLLTHAVSLLPTPANSSRITATFSAISGGDRHWADKGYRQ